MRKRISMILTLKVTSNLKRNVQFVKGSGKELKPKLQFVTVDVFVNVDLDIQNLIEC